MSLAVRERVGSTKQPVGSSDNSEPRTSCLLDPHAPSHAEVLERSSRGHPVLSGTVTFLTRLDPTIFRVLLQRRLSLPLPLSKRSCRCGRLLDAFGHHRAVCSRSGVLGRRGFSLESAVARVCREAGARVATNLVVRDVDLDVPNAHDNRRLEVVADGLPLFGGVQLAMDTILVFAVRGDGQPQRGASNRDGVVLTRARRRRRPPTPNLCDRAVAQSWWFWPWRVGGRWSKEARTFVQLLAQARARSEPFLTRRRMEQAWRLRWYSVISYAAARAFAASLLELRGGHGADGQVPPAHEVERLCG